MKITISRLEKKVKELSVDLQYLAFQHRKCRACLKPISKSHKGIVDFYEGMNELREALEKK